LHYKVSKNATEEYHSLHDEFRGAELSGKYREKVTIMVVVAVMAVMAVMAVIAVMGSHQSNVFYRLYQKHK